MKNTNLIKLFEIMRGLKESDASINPNFAAWTRKTSGEVDILIYDMVKFIEYVEERIINIIAGGGDVTNRSSFTNIIPDLIRKQIIVATMFAYKDKKYCMGAYMVTGSAVNKSYRGKGYGKMLYGLTMVFIYPELLTPDRGSVSSKAERVWKSLEQNPKVKKLPPNKSPFMGKFDDVDDPKTKPKEDDCELHSDRPALNKAYKYHSEKNEQLLKGLQNNHEMVVEKLRAMKVKSFIDWLDIASKFFDEIYYR